MTVERELLRALAVDEHLSVPDRKLLPDGRARASVLRAEIAALVDEVGRFPPDRAPDDAFDGGLLQRLAPGYYRLTTKREVSLMRYDTIKTEDFHSLQAAVDAFIRTHWPGHIDGVLIDWSS